LVRINARDIDDGTDVTDAVGAVRPGGAMIVHVVRAGQPVTIRFTAGVYKQTRATLADLPDQTDRMRRIRSSLLTGK